MGRTTCSALANLALLTGNVGKPYAGVMPMRGQNNVQGACDMGCIPGCYQGYQSVSESGDADRSSSRPGAFRCSGKTGLTLVEYFDQALEGKIKAMYIVGMDVAYSIADANQGAGSHAADRVHRRAGYFPDRAPRNLPMWSCPPPASPRRTAPSPTLSGACSASAKPSSRSAMRSPDWWITCEIARRMGAKGFDYQGPSEIMDEIARLTPSFAGISFARLDEGGIQWPCSHPNIPARLACTWRSSIPQPGRGQFSPLATVPRQNMPDEDYPLLLTTGRSLYHFHLAMTSEVDGLMALSPKSACGSTRGMPNGWKLRTAIS